MIGDRHSGDLGGRLTPGDDAERVIVAVHLDGANATAAQHTAWMLVNLLSRLEGVVEEIELIGGNHQLREGVIPAMGTLPRRSLAEALAAAAALISQITVRGTERASEAASTWHVGPGPAPSLGRRVHGEGFCGGICRSALLSNAESALPFGPYVAACIAAGEVFRSARVPRAAAVDALFFDIWGYRKATAWSGSAGPTTLDLGLDVGLAGGGAVGCAVIHTLWACRGLHGTLIVADDDEQGVDRSNLNRCVLFTGQHVGRQKATTAAAVCEGRTLSIVGVDGRYERSELPGVPPVLASAVDTNTSRHQLQAAFWPARALGASTKDLRAEVKRLGPPGEGPCLGCFNPREADVPDDVIRSELAAMTPGELARWIEARGLPSAQVQAWIRDGGCGQVADSVLAARRAEHTDPPMFSVGFVSVLAGVMLAAETVKTFRGEPTSVLGDTDQVAKFQFFDPTSSANGVPRREMRDARCATCQPDGVGPKVWARRWREWLPPTTGPAAGRTPDPSA